LFGVEQCFEGRMIVLPLIEVAFVEPAQTL